MINLLKFKTNRKCMYYNKMGGMLNPFYKFNCLLIYKEDICYGRFSVYVS